MKKCLPTLVFTLSSMKSSFTRVSLIAVFIVLISFSRSNAQLELVKDVNANVEQLLSDFQFLTDVNGTMYFISNNTLWSSQGTTATTHAISTVNFVSRMININGVLYLAGQLEFTSTGTELLKYVPGNYGIELVKDIYP